MNSASRDSAPAGKLGRLVQAVSSVHLEGASSTLVTGLACDSRAIQPGFLFCALPGDQTDGSRFMEEAARRGAVAVLHRPGIRVPRGLASLVAESPRSAMADLAAAFHGHPSNTLQVIGITGTNGKTTTAYMVRSILLAAGRSCGLIGTIQYEWANRRFPAIRTTPESLDLQRMFSEALHAGCEAMAMEVSSQGLAAERLRGTRFSAAVFTNLTEDHLDFHHTMEAYFSAKKRLFETLFHESADASAVVNMDDVYGRRLLSETVPEGRGLSYGCRQEARVRASEIHIHEHGCTFRVTTPWGERQVELSLAGRFNILNALAAVCAKPLPAV